MYTATAKVVLPTSIIGSLPRPSWYTENLGSRDFREAMVERRYREQYLDAVSVYMRDQEVAGLDIVTDGDCRFDADVAGHNWFSYAPLHMDGFAGNRPYRAKGGLAGIPQKPGHILHDVLETRVMPDLVGPVRRGRLQYAAIWKAAQRQTVKPVKFGTITPELIAMSVRDLHYKELRKSILAVSDALIEALNEVDADVITFETCSSAGMDLEAIGKRIRDKKVCIGVVDHHTLQVETPDQVARLIRKALEHIPAERLVLASDCGMGREG